MSSLKSCNYAVAMLTLIVGIAIAYTSYGYGIGFSMFGLGAGFWPFMLGICLIIVAGLITGDTIVHRQRYDDQPVELTLPQNLSVYKMMLYIGIFIALIFAAGFYIASFLYMILAMYALGERRLGFLLAVSAGFNILVFISFELLLSVTLPTSIFLE